MERVETDFIGLDSFVAEKSKTPSIFPAYDVASLAHKLAHERLGRKSTADMRK